MSISSFGTDLYQGGTSAESKHSFGLSGIIGYVSARWREYRLMRQIESVPYDVMKDVGFPAAERKNEM
jgi:hypothetical protein